MRHRPIARCAAARACRAEAVADGDGGRAPREVGADGPAAGVAHGLPALAGDDLAGAALRGDGEAGRGARPRTGEAALCVVHVGLRAVASVRLRLPPARRSLHRALPAEGRARHQVDDAAEGVRAVERRRRAAQHLHPCDLAQGDGQVRQEVARHGVVQTGAVEQDEDAVERRAAQRQVALHAEGRARLHVHPADGAQEFVVARDGLRAQVRLRPHRHAAARRARGRREARGGDDHRVRRHVHRHGRGTAVRGAVLRGAVVLSTGNGGREGDDEEGEEEGEATRHEAARHEAARHGTARRGGRAATNAACTHDRTRRRVNFRSSRGGQGPDARSFLTSSFPSCLRRGVTFGGGVTYLLVQFSLRVLREV